jgi:F-type H+-transporting ATPase subunit a
MDVGERLMEALEFRTVFTIRLAGFELPVTETVVVTWVVMAILIAASLLLTRRLREVPVGSQVLLETGIDFLNTFTKAQFGHKWARFAPFIGTIFLFLTVANLLPVLSPVGAFGIEPAFTIKPPTRDINVTAALAVLSISIVLVAGFAARGPIGWLKHLAHPTPMMIPFNLLEYLIRPLSLCLRLFGNVLGAFIIMRLIEAVAPIGFPPILSLYFDLLDGMIQALVFTFLTALFVAEAIE